MRITGLVAAATLSACHPVGIVGDGNGPRVSSSICDNTHDNTCSLGGGRGDAILAYAAIAAVFVAPLVLKLFHPAGSYRDR